MSNKLLEFRNTLETLNINELRRRAKDNFGVKLTREDSKEDIINKLVGIMQKADFAAVADGELKPGWARIILHPVPGKPNTPVYFNHNGYSCYVPINVEVDVPLKMVGATIDGEPDGCIQCAGEWTITNDEFGNKITTFQKSHPMTTVSLRAGPDPRPGLEVQRDRKLADKREFLEKFEYWPSDIEVREYKAKKIQDSAKGS